MSLLVTNKTRRPLPRIKYRKIKNAILKERYELSLVLVGGKFSQSLNFKYRGEDKSANVLSFQLSKDEGEIVLDLDAARREASSYGMYYTKFLAYLFIHGCLHLKGMKHGRKMKRMEEKLLSVFM